MMSHPAADGEDRECFKYRCRQNYDKYRYIPFIPTQPVLSLLFLDRTAKKTTHAGLTHSDAHISHTYLYCTCIRTCTCTLETVTQSLSVLSTLPVPYTCTVLVPVYTCFKSYYCLGRLWPCNDFNPCWVLCKYSTSTVLVQVLLYCRS